MFYTASDSESQEKFKIIVHLLWFNMRKETQWQEESDGIRDFPVA
jgi:hypothetical protein